MKCDRCEREASVHEVTIRNGEKVERHLCEQCARQQGISVASEEPPPLVTLLSQFVTVQGTDTPPGDQEADAKAQALGQMQQCPACGLTFAQFKTDGQLGCAICYQAMQAQLGPILQRAHEGATHHVGKVPRRVLERLRAAGAPGAHGAATRPVADRAGAEELERTRTDRLRRLALLRKQLGEAVTAEQYERAAKIRDEVKRVEVELHELDHRTPSSIAGSPRQLNDASIPDRSRGEAPPAAGGATGEGGEP